MISLLRPSRPTIERFLAEQSQQAFTYPHVGASAGAAPAGYTSDETRARLGSGEVVFRRAAAALGRWQHFQLGWVEPCWPETPVAVGSTIGVLAKAFGLWSVNACRVIEVVERETSAGLEYGFSYGTLPGHAATGEERFLIAWNRADDSVWYTIRAFSRPKHILTRLGYPVFRLTQARFRRDSPAAMLRAVG